MTAPRTASPFSLAMFWGSFHFVRILKRRGSIAWIVGALLGSIILRLVGTSEQWMASTVVFYIVPLMGLSYGTGALREEVEDQTLTYAFTRPLPRAWVYAARLGAAISLVALVGCVSTAIAAPSILGGLRLVGVSLLAAVAYTSFFGALGLLFKRPAWIGIFVVLACEHGLGLVPGFLSKLTLLTHLRTLADLPPSSGLARILWDPPTWWLSLLVALGFAAASIALGTRITAHREFVLTR